MPSSKPARTGIEALKERKRGIEARFCVIKIKPERTNEVEETTKAAAAVEQ